MKKKIQKSKNGSQRMTFNKTTKLSQQMDEDRKVYNLRVTKKKKNKDEVCESTKTAPRNMRKRPVTNYSETLKVVKSKTEEKKVNKKSSVVINSDKRVPIYKTVELVEEKVQNPEEIYEFIDDDLPETSQKVKKKKYRKPLKQAKKLIRIQYIGSMKATKPRKKASKNVQLKEQKKQSITELEQKLKHNVSINMKIPEHLQTAGDCTVAEASTILNKISDQRLEKGNRTSPNSSVISSLNTQESDMSNYALIRQSISPIAKEVDNLLIESPRKSTDTFSQVQKIAQSTPQINRVLVGQEKKPLAPMNLNKSIASEDTIHLSSMVNEKLTSQNMADVAQVQKEKNVLPRKFGTVISNLNSVETVTTTLKQALLQQKQSSLKAVLPPNSSENYENDQEMQDDILSESSILTAVSSEPKSNKEKSKTQKENKNPELVAGPSKSEKPIAIVLKQSNLNHFLNLDEIPECTRISTHHGIFDDGINSPINRKKSNLENKFGLINYDYSEKLSPTKEKSIPIIATARDVARSVKGKLFVKARVKSSLTRRVPENMIKKTLLKNILKNNAPKLKAPVNEEIVKESDTVYEKSRNKSLVGDENEKSKSLMDENENMNIVEDEIENNVSFMEDENENNVSFMEDISEKNAGHKEDENEENAGHEDENNETNTNPKGIENSNISLDPKKAYVDSISFSDTFDFLSENGDDISSIMPEDIPIFVDLEPVHFSQPPRRSYTKTKKAIFFNPSRFDSESECSEGDDYDKPKKKRKKASRLNKEEHKRMQEWIKSVNETFDEIDRFNLTIE